MWTLLKHPSHTFPVAVDRKDPKLVEFIMTGYESIMDGSEAQIKTKQEQLTAGVVANMDDAFWGLIL